MILLFMWKIRFVALLLFSILTLNSCQTVTNKINEKTTFEEKELSKWLNKSESELKIQFGKPDKIEFLKTRNRNYVYKSKKFKIKCERKFEINPNKVVIGFSSRNCF